MVIFIILTQPCLILVDHGHFQYNSVSLGLTVWGVVAVISDWDVPGSIAFCLALNYKQMELYHSLPFFCYLLGKAMNRNVSAPFIIVKLGLVVTFVFVVCWIPFYLFSGVQGVLQVLSRVFPFTRGIYEDKVASFWCSISVVIKIRNIIPPTLLVWMSIGVTLLTAMPSLWNLLRNPTPYRFLISLVNIIGIHNYYN